MGLFRLHGEKGGDLENTVIEKGRRKIEYFKTKNDGRSDMK